MHSALDAEEFVAERGDRVVGARESEFRRILFVVLPLLLAKVAREERTERQCLVFRGEPILLSLLLRFLGATSFGSRSLRIQPFLLFGETRLGGFLCVRRLSRFLGLARFLALRAASAAAAAFAASALRASSARRADSRLGSRLKSEMLPQIFGTKNVNVSVRLSMTN